MFPNPTPERDYTIQFEIPEFTCHCPLTGQPDFAHFTIDMVADKLCVELKSLKLYFWSYRDVGAFHEKVTNDIVDDIVKATDPRFIRITAKWNVRGGIYTNVVAEHRQKGWKPQPRVEPAMNPLLARLHPYPFERLRALTADITPSRAHRPISLGIGEPKHPTPTFIRDALTASLDGLAQYPATAGEPALRKAIAGWVERRYGVTIDPTTQVLPVNGSREALFAFAQTVIDPTRPHAAVVCPNPFYQIYEGAALLAGARTLYANSDPARNFASDWAGISDARMGGNAAALRLLAGQPDRRGRAARRMAAAVRAERPLRLRDRIRRVLLRDLLPRRAAARRARGRAPARPRRLPQPDRLHEPVEALERAGPALRLRRRRCDAC